MRCDWCWRSTDALAVTVTGDDTSPDLCDSCTDAWDAGCRKYIDKIRMVVRR
jgi:hypothetical protein